MERDTEKAMPVKQLGSASSSSSIEDTEPDSAVLEPTYSIKTTKSRHSTASRRLDGTDPYENLEHAMTSDPDMIDAERAGADEEEDDDDEPIERTRTVLSTASAASRLPDYEVVFEENDPENPRNWPLWYRAWMLFSVAFTCWVVVLYSTTYASSTPGLMADFGSSTTVTTLGMTTYLLGLATGSIFLAPMSELYGRQPVYVACLLLWAVLIIPSGVAQSLTAILVSRFFW